MERTLFTAEFAGIPIAVSCPSQRVRDFCADYITERPGVFSVHVSEEDIAAESARADSVEAGDGGDILYELSALHRAIAEKLPLYGRFLMHGAAITYGGGAYLFCAPSGVGKSTHIALWRRYLGDGVDIINGDKPFLSLEDAQAGEHIRVHGSPWAGKELWQKNRSATLRAVCLITRGKENSIRRLDAAGCLDALMRQIYIPRNAESAQATLELTDALVRLVPVFELRCNVSEEAVRCSFEALTGLAYQAEKSAAGK